jgi:uncharacterized protein (DUF488 family)
MLPRSFNTIFTIGYEGADLDDFLATLRTLEIKHVVDIREIAASRRFGFSKNLLRCRLEDCGIAYSHLKALGDPKEGRDAMRRGDRLTFERVFTDRMNTIEAKVALDQLRVLVASEVIVLLCYERDPKGCHRSIVAAAIRNDDQHVRHVGVNARAEASRFAA